MFKIETLDPLLEGVVIKTDQDRINEVITFKQIHINIAHYKLHMLPSG